MGSSGGMRPVASAIGAAARRSGRRPASLGVMSERPDHMEPASPDRNLKWIAPALLAVVIVVPIVILIVSNTDQAEISWAGWAWEAPRWVVLLATFLAGMLAAPAMGWWWRRWRRRRKAERAG